MTITARVLADTASPEGHRLMTLLLRYPRFIHAELLTHRCFSRNSESSRAVNAVKRSKLAVYNPAEIGRDRKGMSSREPLTGWRLALARLGWEIGVQGSKLGAWVMRRAEAHKQWANRPLDWCAYIEVVVTGDAEAWESFFALRCHEDAQPEMQELAMQCLICSRFSTPKVDTVHIPWDIGPGYNMRERMLASAGYCAAVSYLTHGQASPRTAIALGERLLASTPKHWSPFEHGAIVSNTGERHANFTGWRSFRYIEAA